MADKTCPLFSDRYTKLSTKSVSLHVGTEGIAKRIRHSLSLDPGYKEYQPYTVTNPYGRAGAHLHSKAGTTTGNSFACDFKPTLDR